jgi:CHAT domain-containing protein
LETLYDMLIDPIKNKLTTSHLIIIPHNILHYLPFTALTDGKNYLIDEYAITLLPSASVLPFIQAKIYETNYPPLVVGNPTLDLFSAVNEANEIAALYNVKPLIGNQATEWAIRQQLTQSRILHLATHGKYDNENPLSSTISLASDTNSQGTLNDGQLQVREVLSLDLKQTDLVVLSACSTQIGNLTLKSTVMSGDEITSLPRAFFFAGTPTVIATLWPVDDAATTTLMEQFYTHLRAGMSKADALRQAQLSIKEKYPNPHYWAAFTLSGNGE